MRIRSSAAPCVWRLSCNDATWTTRLNRQRKGSRWGSVGFGWLSGWVSLGMVGCFFFFSLLVVCRLFFL